MGTAIFTGTRFDSLREAAAALLEMEPRGATTGGSPCGSGVERRKEFPASPSQESGFKRWAKLGAFVVGGLLVVAAISGFGALGSADWTTLGALGGFASTGAATGADGGGGLGAGSGRISRAGCGAGSSITFTTTGAVVDGGGATGAVEGAVDEGGGEDGAAGCVETEGEAAVGGVAT